MTTICKIETCSNSVYGLEMCSKHYSRWYRTGDPLYTSRAPMGLSLEERLDYVGYEVNSNGCHIWLGRCNEFGYGVLKYAGRWQGVHRLVFSLTNDLLPNVVIRHKCDNPPCINPAHLIPGTQADNITDMVIRARNRTRRSLTWEQVTEVRSRYAEGNTTQSELEKEYGLSSGSVSRIVTYKTYNMEY